MNDVRTLTAAKKIIKISADHKLCVETVDEYVGGFIRTSGQKISTCVLIEGNDMGDVLDEYTSDAWFAECRESYGTSTGAVLYNEEGTSSVTPTGKVNIAVSIAPNGAATVTGAGKYDAGETVTLTATPNGSYQFKNWMSNGQILGSSPTLTFTASESKTIYAMLTLPQG